MHLRCIVLIINIFGSVKKLIINVLKCFEIIQLFLNENLELFVFIKDLLTRWTVIFQLENLWWVNFDLWETSVTVYHFRNRTLPAFAWFLLLHNLRLVVSQILFFDGFEYLGKMLMLRIVTWDSD